jgi:hypothetical protein
MRSDKSIGSTDRSRRKQLKANVDRPAPGSEKQKLVIFDAKRKKIAEEAGNAREKTLSNLQKALSDDHGPATTPQVHCQGLANKKHGDNITAKLESPASEASTAAQSRAFPTFSAVNLALSQQHYAPLNTITTISSQSVASNVSNANATVTSKMVGDSYPPVKAFRSVSGESPISDPFKASAWLSDSDDMMVWIPAPGGKNPFTKTKRVQDNALIMTIKKASSREKESHQHKPDPSPKGGSSVNSLLDFSVPPFSCPPAKARKNHPDGGLEPSFYKSSSMGRPKEPPKGIPSNAILGSMLYRHAFSDEKDDHNMNKVDSPHSSNYDTEQDEIENDDEMKHPIVPPNILTSSKSESVVSGVTDEASSAYFDSSNKFDRGWNKQAQNMLTKIRNVKEFKDLRAFDMNARRGTKTSSLMDRVVDEEMRSTAEMEHMNMFSA